MDWTLARVSSGGRGGDMVTVPFRIDRSTDFRRLYVL
jgi:hypothetical protein